MKTVSDIQRRMLLVIKQSGQATNTAIAEHIDISYEAVRQHLRQLEAVGLIVSRTERTTGAHAGRPTTLYSVTTEGEHVFPKVYDELLIQLIDKVSITLGPDALRRVLTAMTDDKVEEWRSKLDDKSLEERLEALKNFFMEDDPYTEVVTEGNSPKLIEHNCPLLNVAHARPALCSVSVSALSRLLGYRVTREARFQDGDARCVFRVDKDQPVDPEQFRFDFEDENAASTND